MLGKQPTFELHPQPRSFRPKIALLLLVGWGQGCSEIPEDRMELKGNGARLKRRELWERKGNRKLRHLWTPQPGMCETGLNAGLLPVVGGGRQKAIYSPIFAIIFVCILISL